VFEESPQIRRGVVVARGIVEESRVADCRVPAAFGIFGRVAVTYGVFRSPMV